jgi:hypothetical protein
MEMYNLALAASTLYTPNGKDTVATLYTTVSCIIRAVGVNLPAPLFVGQAVKRASFS